VLAPLTPLGAAVAIRRFPKTPPEEPWAVASGWIEEPALALLKAAVRDRVNILVSGGTSSGKTTLLGFLTRFVPAEQRLITAEDVMELRLAHGHALRLQARVSNGDGVGAITIRDLVRAALRLRPDRIIVGECRGAEVLDMLQAMNTGHPGSLTTIHANSAADALPRLELLALLSDGALTLPAVQSWVRSAIGLVVHVGRDDGGRRRVTSILKIGKTGEDQVIYERT
jgi:pilus assembly protein CpaF